MLDGKDLRERVRIGGLLNPVWRGVTRVGGMVHRLMYYRRKWPQ